MTEPRIEWPEETTSIDTYRWLSKCSAHKESIRERERERKREKEREREREMKIWNVTFLHPVRWGNMIWSQDSSISNKTHWSILCSLPGLPLWRINRYGHESLLTFNIVCCIHDFAFAAYLDLHEISTHAYNLLGIIQPLHSLWTTLKITSNHHFYLKFSQVFYHLVLFVHGDEEV